MLALYNPLGVRISLQERYRTPHLTSHGTGRLRLLPPHYSMVQPLRTFCGQPGLTLLLFPQYSRAKSGTDARLVLLLG